MRALIIGASVINLMAFLLCLYVSLENGFTSDLVTAMTANITLITGLVALKVHKGY